MVVALSTASPIFHPDPPPTGEREPTTTSGEGPQRANILVVDDRPDKLVVFRELLEDLGQNVYSASSGDEALRQVLERDFALILLDVNMPGLDGLETAALIRSRRKSAHTPIILVTADYGDELIGVCADLRRLRISAAVSSPS